MAYNQNNPNGNATASASAPVTLASDNNGPVKVWDGTNTATVKAASTAAVATDKAVVVAVSPNNTVPVSLATAPTTPVTGTFWQATQPVSLATNTPTLAAGSNIVGKVGIDQTTVGTTNAISLAQLGATTIATGNGTSSAGTLRVAIASDQTTNTNPLLVKQAVTTTSSGLLIAKVLSAANTTPVQVKTTAGQLYGWHLFNNASTTRFVRVFNVSTSPTMGTTSPTFVLPLPAGGGAVLSPDNAGVPLGTGFFYSVTTGAADLDNTAGAANDVIGTFFYI